MNMARSSSIWRRVNRCKSVFAICISNDAASPFEASHVIVAIVIAMPDINYGFGHWRSAIAGSKNPAADFQRLSFSLDHGTLGSIGFVERAFSILLCFALLSDRYTSKGSKRNV